MKSAIQPKKTVLKIKPYKGGVSQIDGISDPVKLSSNENPAGFSDMAKEAFLRSAYGFNRYPDGSHLSLREAIGNVHSIDAGRIICGAGSDEVIGMLTNAYAGKGDEVIHTEHGFLMYRIAALTAGARPIEVSETNRFVDVDAILAACNQKTKIVFIANPANPTGTMISLTEIQRLADNLPDHVLLVIDGAYAEYVDGYDGGLALAEARENIFITRTFSKIYGLSALRIGWGYGAQQVINVLNRVRGPFNLSTTQQEVAIAAVHDQDWVVKCKTDNARLRDYLMKVLEEVCVPCDESFANFVLARFDSVDKATACNEFLLSQGLIVRSTSDYKLANCLRISVGDEPSCRRVAYAIGQFMESS